MSEATAEELSWKSGVLANVSLLPLTMEAWGKKNWLAGRESLNAKPSLFELNCDSVNFILSVVDIILLYCFVKFDLIIDHLYFQSD